jgi:hypothetical protein
MGKTSLLTWILGAALSIAACPLVAHADVPDCLGSDGTELAVNNAQVLQWKVSTPNQTLERAHIQGTLVQLFPDEHGHNHFSVQIGNQPGDAIEVVYNISFGALPQLTPGMNVEACGDYITSTAQAGPYPASPDGAILHWVHLNPSGHGHASGYVAIDGQAYGQGHGHGNRNGNG